MRRKIDRYALVSVFDKTGIVEFTKVLIHLGYQIISTGGTGKMLSENGIEVIPIQSVTGNPESFDGRMKTISFQVESGILFDRSKISHQKEAKKLKIPFIDIVVCNLYPFEQTAAKRGVKLDEAVESIDVGGPTMIRAAAKNFKHVLVVVDPHDYPAISMLLRSSILFEKRRKELAAKAFRHLSFYDAQIALYLDKKPFPHEFALPLRKLMTLRYGENPHQKGAFYGYPHVQSLLHKLKKRWGRDLSLVNLTDINAGIEAVRLFREYASVVIKHNSPCGIALGKTGKEALARAIEADPQSAFGGVVVTNFALDTDSASVIASFKDEKKGTIDVVACPRIDVSTLSFLQTIRKSMGVYTFGIIPRKTKDPYNIKWVDGGLVLQTHDNNIDKSFLTWKTVTTKKPTGRELQQMQIAWKFLSRIRSNTIVVIDKNLPMTRGIGSGQTSRIRSTKIALEQAGNFTKGGILASDSFFPFEDCVKLAAKNGIAAIVQQGGSINDNASIAAANKARITMVFTGRRAFWH